MGRNAIEYGEIQTNWDKGVNMNYGVKDTDFVSNPSGVKTDQHGEYRSINTGWGGFTNANPTVTTGRTMDGPKVTPLQTHSTAGVKATEAKAKVV